jgi:SHS2 domain-containing protein
VGRWRIVEDVALADCALEVDGADLDDLFETVAVALAELMVDPATLSLTMERSISLRADTLDLLLYDWISELIFLKDRDSAVFPRCQVRTTDARPCALTAQVKGGVIDRERTSLGLDPKAVTFHCFALDRGDGGWRARFVIDI